MREPRDAMNSKLGQYSHRTTMSRSRMQPNALEVSRHVRRRRTVHSCVVGYPRSAAFDAHVVPVLLAKTLPEIQRGTG